MSSFRDWLRTEAQNNTNRLGALADRTLVVITVSRRRWRGQRLVVDAKVEVGGEATKEDATTEPRWRLVPDEVKELFENVSKSVDGVLNQYAVNSLEVRGGMPGESDDEGSSGVIGRGMYVIDTSHYPRVVSLINHCATAWNRHADELCTDEGYQRLRDAIREKVGDSHFSRVEPLIPNKQKLRAKFALTCNRLPIRFDPGINPSEDVKNGAAAMVVEAVELAVRKPRERLAGILDAAAARLVETNANGQLIPVQSFRKDKTGAVVPKGRNFSVTTLQSVIEEVKDFDTFSRFVEHDDGLHDALGKLKAVLPTDEVSQSSFAATLRTNDDDAVRFGRDLLNVSTAAKDESGMCAAVTGCMA